MKYEIKGGTLPVAICHLEAGEVWIQTMPINKVAGAVRPYMPTGN